MRKATPYNNVKPGDIVVTKRRLRCRYWDYPEGRNMFSIPAGSPCEVIAVMIPKVRRRPSDLDPYLYFMNIRWGEIEAHAHYTDVMVLASAKEIAGIID